MGTIYLAKRNDMYIPSPALSGAHCHSLSYGPILMLNPYNAFILSQANLFLNPMPKCMNMTKREVFHQQVRFTSDLTRSLESFRIDSTMN